MSDVSIMTEKRSIPDQLIGSFKDDCATENQESFRKSSAVSTSGVNSDCSKLSNENFLNRFVKQRSLQDFYNRKTDDKIEPIYHRARSNSDGAAVRANSIRNADAFPSLPNSVLERMGLHGDAPKELLSEETLEQKFTSLSLAFAIDAATIKDRRERQRRTRDQTENNLAQEIEKLRGKLALLEPLCTDFESAELLSILLAQIEIITKASSLASIAAERYGAVQHEDRLTESVQLMVNHVQALKHQRDSARRQLQYTKRVLQGVPENPSANPAAPQKLLLNANRKFITRRRASLGTVNTAHDQNANKLSRRTSDLSIRATSLTKGGRPNRLELGGELLKIKEDFAHEAVVEQLNKQVREEEEDEEANLDANSLKEEMIVKKIESSLGSPAPLSNISFRNNILVRTFSNKFKLSLEDIRHELSERLKNWSENDYFYAFFNFCAVVCFSISILTLVRMYLEYEYTKRGYTESYFSWFWPTNKPGSAKYKKK